MKPIHLTSPANPRVKATLQLRHQKDRRQRRLFVAEGYREITRAAAAGLTLRELFWQPELCHDIQPHIQNLLQRYPLAHAFTLSPALFDKLAYRENPEGLVAVFEQPQWRLDDFSVPPPQPQPPASPSHPEPHPELWLVATGTQKPGNLGAMARSAEAAGCTGLLVADALVDAFNPNAIRASTGAVFRLPIIPAPADQIISFLTPRRITILGLSPHAPTPYDQADLTGPLAIVVGSEDAGLGPPWLDHSTQQHTAPLIQLVSIPMHSSTIDSLNASVATAVVLFEALRQRRATSRSTAHISDMPPV